GTYPRVALSDSYSTDPRTGTASAVKGGVLHRSMRILFLCAVAGGVWWGWRREGEAVVEALSRTSPLSAFLALACVLVGLVITAVLWSRLLAAHGYLVGTR